MSLRRSMIFSLGALKSKYSYFYDGTNNFVSFGNILNTYLSGSTPKFSIRVVCRRVGISTLQYIVSKVNATGNQRQISLRFSATNKIEVTTSVDGTSANQSVITSTNTFSSTLTWYDIVYVFDGTQSGINKYKLYVNGTSEAMSITSGTPGAIFASSANLKFGNIDNGSQWLNGYLNQEGITSDVITSTEVITLYNSGVPKLLRDVCDNVVLLTYHNNDTFDGTNWTLIDNSGNGNNGTSSGMLAIDRDANETPY